MTWVTMIVVVKESLLAVEGSPIDRVVGDEIVGSPYRSTVLLVSTGVTGISGEDRIHLQTRLLPSAFSEKWAMWLLHSLDSIAASLMVTSRKGRNQRASASKLRFGSVRGWVRVKLRFRILRES